MLSSVNTNHEVHELGCLTSVGLFIAQVRGARIILHGEMSAEVMVVFSCHQMTSPHIEKDLIAGWNDGKQPFINKERKL